MRKGMVPLIIACMFTLLFIRVQNSDALDTATAPKKLSPTNLIPSNNIRPALNLPKNANLITLPAELDTLTSSSNLNSWQTATATVTLTKPASASGATIVLSCNDPTLLAVPPTVVVPGGGLSQTFTVSAKSFGASGPAIIIASYQGTLKTSAIQVYPGNRVTMISGLPNYLKTASQAAATVGIAGTAPAGGCSVPLYIRRPADAIVPASVLIPAGKSTGTLTITSGQQPGMVLIYSDQQAYESMSSTGLTKVQIVVPPKLSTPTFQICTQNTSTCYTRQPRSRAGRAST